VSRLGDVSAATPVRESGTGSNVLEVRAGVPAEDVLRQAVIMLDCAERIAHQTAYRTDIGETPNVAGMYAVGYLTAIGRALVESLHHLSGRSMA
jgi:hypothetical protein